MDNKLNLFLLTLFFVFQSYAQEDSIQSKKPEFGIYPAVGYSPETAFQLGAISIIVFQQNNPTNEYYRPTALTPYFLWTTKKQISSMIDLDIFFKNLTSLNADLGFSKFPDKYYGIGNRTNPKISEWFTDQYLKFDGRFMKILKPELFAGLVFDFRYTKILKVVEEGMLIADNPTGFNGGRNFGLGVGIIIDSRDHTLYPTRGKFFNSSLNSYSKFWGSEYNYLSYTLDFRQYFKLLIANNIVAYQFRMDLNSGMDIPFYKLPELGGDDQLRGISNANLYQDRQSIFFQIESRQSLFWRFGGVLFAGAGEVFHSLNDFSINQIRFVYGLGGRFQAIKDEKLNIRLDLGFTDNGQHAFYLSVREAF